MTKHAVKINIMYNFVDVINKTINKMKEFGVTPIIDFPDNRKATLIKLNSKSHMEYWLGFNNFYVITRYNRSTHYAMSVLLLSEKIRALRDSEKTL